MRVFQKPLKTIATALHTVVSVLCRQEVRRLQNRVQELELDVRMMRAAANSAWWYWREVNELKDENERLKRDLEQRESGI